MTGNKKEIVTVKNIRNINTENILQSLLKSQNTTRSILAKENHVSLMTVKHIVDNLIRRRIIVEKESSNSDLGRNPKVLELCEDYGNIVCVNLTSKDEISFLIYDVHERLLKEKSVQLSEENTYKSQLLETIEEIKESLVMISTQTVAAAVFVPSAYDAALDLVNYDLIPDLKELHIRELFREQLQIDEILVLHDVFAAARSEYDSSNPKAESQFYFYCGYGVGGCFIHKGEAVVGAENMAGEVGKMLVSMEGSEEGYRILEDVVSVSAIKRRMKEEGIALSFVQLLELYKADDETAVRILTPVLNNICRVLYNLLWVYNPTRIVIDSCKKEYSELITECFQRFTENMLYDAIPIHAQIRQAKYDEYHKMRGCFHMARNKWIEKIADEQ